MQSSYLSFAEYGTLVKIPANKPATFSYQGHEDEPFFILVSGICALQATSKRGEELTLFYFKEGEMMGYSPALNDMFPLENEGDYLYSERDVYNIVAKTDSTALCFPYKYFQPLWSKNENFRMVLLESLHRHHISLTGRSSYSANHSAVSTLCTMLARNAMRDANGKHVLKEPFSYAELARRIGVHQVTVARIMRELIAEGTLSRSGHRIFVENSEQLLRYAREELQLKY